MTEYNTFCYSKSFDNENSFQQKRYRVFNTEVGETRYYKIKGKIDDILKDFNPNLKDNSWSDEWKKITAEQWNKLMALAKEVRGDDFREGFEYISGIELLKDDLVEIQVEGKTKKISRVSAKELGLIK